MTVVVSCHDDWTGISTEEWREEASAGEVWHGWTAAVLPHLHHLVSAAAFLTVGNNLCA